MEPVSIILTTVGWIIKPLVSKFVGEFWERYTKHVGLDKEAGSLKNELMNIQLLVEAAQSKQLPNEKVHLHRSLKNLKTLVYKAQDLLDELDYFRLQKEVKEMNHAEQAISTKINALVKELQQKYQNVQDALKLEQLCSIALAIQLVTQKVTTERQQTDAYYKETHIYGRDKERDQILELIRCGIPRAQELPVVAIVGHGGVGKTTLAKLVYNDPGINSSFDLRMWICVSTNFDVMGITRQMLEYSQGNSKNEHTNLNILKDILKDSLKGKNLLLVLDDIWEIKKGEWDSLLAPLVTNEKSNMVLVTTRLPSIGNMVRTTDPILLDGLDDSSFWSLFKKSAFGSDQYDVPYALEKIGREIVKKLKGNPLAAKTVGALLKDNIDGLHWMRVFENETWKSQEGDGGIMSALQMSYEYLPVHLQQCFSYCSLFPKDYYFNSEELIHMWMDQGYIYDEKKRKEDVGIDYLNILVERAFVQLIRDHFGDPSYVIHDLMHDLAQAVSVEECLSIDNPRHIPRPPPPNLRHLCIHGDQVEEMDNSLDLKNLRSLIIIRGNQKLCNDLKLDQTNSIRLLVLESPPLNYPLLNSYNFTSFIHLRYLKLRVDKYSDCSGDNIIAQICTLYHLEVLEFDFYVMRLPNFFNNLVNLRHFVVSGPFHYQIARLGKLKHLQELKEFHVLEEDGFELDQLAGLKELKGSLVIFNIKIVKCGKDAQSAKLLEKEIDSLTLSWREFNDFTVSVSKESNPNHVISEEILEVLQPNIKLRNLCIEYYEGRKSPSWLANCSVEYLEFIQLSHCESWEVLPYFGELGFLKKLSLSSLPKVREFTSQFHGCSSKRGFPSLTLMEVVNMAELETWVWSEQCKVFPVLKTVTIKNCPKLKELPNFGELRFLEELSMSTLPKVREFTSQFHGCSFGRGFPSLTLMEVKMAELETWVWSDQCEVFPVLKTLTIKDCPKLKDCTFVPFGGQETTCFPHLSHLTIRGCPQLQQKNPILCIGSTSETYLERLVSSKKSEPSPLWHNKPPQLEVELGDLEIPRALDQVLVFKYFRHIKSIRVSRCPNLTCLPWKGICLLDCLETLEIRGCPKLLLSPDEEGDEGKSFLSNSSLQSLMIDGCGITGEELSYLLACLPGIRVLVIHHCANVTAVLVPSRINDSDVGMPQTASLGSLMFLVIWWCSNMYFVNKEGLSGLTSLRAVDIYKCQNIFSSMTQEEQDDSTGCFPVNLERLSLNCVHVPDKMSWSATNLTSLRNLMIIDSPSLTFLDLYPFVALRELVLCDCKNLACVKGPNSLVSLESLTVKGCPSLVSSWRSASRELDQEFLLTLKGLQIDTVEILSLPACQFLKSLQNLRIEGYKGKNSFTEEQEEALLLLTALKELTFYDCIHMQSLPRKLYRHPSLNKLTIGLCPLIDRLPDKGLPKSLKKVQLIECSSKLKRECSKISNLEVYIER